MYFTDKKIAKGIIDSEYHVAAWSGKPGSPEIHLKRIFAFIAYLEKGQIGYTEKKIKQSEVIGNSL